MTVPIAKGVPMTPSMAESELELLLNVIRETAQITTSATACALVMDAEIPVSMEPELMLTSSGQLGAALRDFCRKLDTEPDAEETLRPPNKVAHYMARREIEAELRLAIQRDELSLFYQPIVDLQTGHIRCFEALLRWFHPTKGELRPAEFIPVAEETGVIVTLGNWITRQAALACAQWPEDISVAVNLSPLQIKAPGAVLAIKQALRDAKLDPHRLELEVTESLFIQDSEQTAEFIKELSAEGVRFALDDFGTGYSSLSYIHKFPFSKIKVDRCFVSGDDVGPRAHAIIRAVAEMGRGLDMEIVAEGLEEQEQVETVRDAGCTLGQGYFFSRAVPDYLAAMLLAQDRDGDGLRAA